MIDTDKFRADKDSDLLFCTVRMYKLFLSQRNGLEAFQLYMHLMFSARLQETNQVRTTNLYLKRGLNWGEAKVKRAKSLLVKLGLIEYVRRRDKKTKQIIGVYIKLSKVWSRETLIRKLSTSSKATGSKSYPVAATGSKSYPVAATGSKSYPVAIEHKCLKLKSTNSLSKEIKRLKLRRREVRS